MFEPLYQLGIWTTRSLKMDFASFDGANFVLRSLNAGVAEYVTSNPHDFTVDHDKISRSNDTVIIFPDDSVIRSSVFFSRYIG